MNALLRARPLALRLVPDPFLAMMLAYFGAHVLIRTIISPALELDEAEQALWTQTLALGYGAQPPLYTWLQWAMFELVGVSVLALALLKNGLLFLLYAATYGAAKRLLSPSLAALAAACLLLIPDIGWESQRDLTHTVLVTTLAACLLYVVTRLLVEGPHPVLYLALGVVCGLGVLAKYSFVMVAGAWLVAMLVWPPGRRLLLSPWVALAALIAVVLVAPHALWLLDHWHLASEGTLRKMGTESAQPWAWWQQAGVGLGALLQALVASLAPLVLVLGAVFGLAAWRRGGLPAHSPLAGIAWQMAAAILILLLIQLMTGATQLKTRWLAPLLVPAPLLWLGWVQQASSPRREAWLRAIVIAIASLYLLAMALRPWFDAARGRPDELNEPVAALAQVIRTMGLPADGLLLADTNALAGGLRIQFPLAWVGKMEQAPAALDLTSYPMAVIIAHHPLPPPVAAACAELRTLSLPYLYAPPNAPPARYHLCKLEGAGP